MGLSWTSNRTQGPESHRCAYNLNPIIQRHSNPPFQKSHLKLSPLEVRAVARKTALEAIKEQREQFRQLGIMADWDSETETYRTMGASLCRMCADGLES